MSANRKKPPELSMLQVKADIVAAESCLAEAEKTSVKLAKYLRGGSAGIIYNKPVKK